MFKKSDNIESGRTVLEAILVLVVLAIIGVFAAKIFMDLTNKNKAQLLEREVVLAHSKLGLQANKKTGDWAVYPYPTSGDYQLMYRFDVEGHAFIKLEGVKEDVCSQLLREAKTMRFLTPENREMVSCEEQNTMIISTDKADNFVECRFDSQCGGTERDYCYNGICAHCTEGHYYDPETGNCEGVCVSDEDCGTADNIFCDLSGGTGRCVACSGGRIYDGQGSCVCPHARYYEVFDGEKCVCPSGYFRNTNGNCTNCELNEGKATTKEECDKCPNREMSNGQCVLACGSGYFRTNYNGQNNCYACSAPGWYEATEDACAKCDGTATPRKMMGDKCVRESCDSGYFQIENGHCEKCVSNNNYAPLNAAECAKCSNRYLENGICVSPMFHDLWGHLVSCADEEGVNATAEGCAECDNTNTPRHRASIGYDRYPCVLDNCPTGKFSGHDGYYIGCHDCSSLGAFYVENASECTKCSDREIQQNYSGDSVCVLKTCPAGTIRGERSRKCLEIRSGKFVNFNGDVWNNCSDPNNLSGAEHVTAESCALCDNTAYPRRMITYNNRNLCVRQSCDSGYFHESSGICVECSTTALKTPLGADASAKEAECALCDNTNYPREMVNGKCIIQTCPSGFFKDSNGECKSCSDTTSYTPWNENSCSACDNSDSPREMVNGKCAITGSCGTGLFKDNYGGCIACSDTYTSRVPLNASECAQCSTTDYPREMIGEFCVLQSQTCDSGQFMGRASDEKANCLPCGKINGIVTTASRCAACDGTGWEREMFGNLCVRSVCNDGYIKNSEGTCVECSSGNLIPNDPTECSSRCSRVMIGDYCMAACASEQYQKADGSCQNCSSTASATPLSEAECLKCNTQSLYPHYFENNTCYSSGCERKYFKNSSGSCTGCGSITNTPPKDGRACSFCDAFRASNNRCTECARNDAVVPYSNADCGMCADSGYPRHIETTSEGDKCVPTCSSIQTSCRNATSTNFWCCPEGTDCGAGDSEATKCVLTSATGQCAYTLSGSAPYTITMDSAYGECPSGKYCFGKWTCNGSIASSTSTKFYGICIDMDDTIDTAAKDALNPWLSSPGCD